MHRFCNVFILRIKRPKKKNLEWAPQWAEWELSEKKNRKKLKVYSFKLKKKKKQSREERKLIHSRVILKLQSFSYSSRIVKYLKIVSKQGSENSFRNKIWTSFWDYRNFFLSQKKAELIKVSKFFQINIHRDLWMKWSLIFNVKRHGVGFARGWNKLVLSIAIISTHVGPIIWSWFLLFWKKKEEKKVTIQRTEKISRYTWCSSSRNHRLIVLCWIYWALKQFIFMYVKIVCSLLQ